MKKIICLLLSLSIASFAKDLPESPKPKFLNTEDKIAIGALATTIITDSLSTQHFLGLPAHVQVDGKYLEAVQIGEVNPLARPFVKTRKGQAFASGMAFGGQLGLMYWAHRTGHERIKHLVPFIGVGFESWMTMRNYHLIHEWNKSTLPTAQRF